MLEQLPGGLLALFDGLGVDGDLLVDRAELTHGLRLELGMESEVRLRITGLTTKSGRRIDLMGMRWRDACNCAMMRERSPGSSVTRNPSESRSISGIAGSYRRLAVTLTTIPHVLVMQPEDQPRGPESEMLAVEPRSVTPSVGVW